MELFEPGTFHYLNKQLYCEHRSVAEIADAVGTPVFIYSKKFLVDRYREFDEAFGGVKHSIFFACKSNFNLNIIKILCDLGAGVDVNSGGELYRAIKAGVTPDRIILSGVGKTREEIKLALEYNIKMLKAESWEEIQLINKVAEELSMIAPLAIRVNPDVDAKTHPYISTGLAENKFGITSSEAEELFADAAKLANIHVMGIDMHIGSQITTVEPFVEAVGKMAALYKSIKARGIDIEHFDIGGGIGVRYRKEEVFTPKQLAEALKDVLSEIDCEIVFEPGRYFSANAGILVTEVLFTKSNHGKSFVIVDSAMTELFRPTLYGAYHHIQPVTLTSRTEIVADIVGPVCESSDFLAKGRLIEKCMPGDRLAIMTAGAYGMVMSSNYNGRRRPPEVIVDGSEFFVTRSRESYEHLLWDEEIVEDLHKLPGE